MRSQEVVHKTKLSWNLEILLQWRKPLCNNLDISKPMVFDEPNINHDLQTLMQTNVIEIYFHPHLSTVQKQNKLFRG